ncbi:MAG: imelysin family protein [Xanthomarina gelatinilytica]|uniref:imelysin family protein n=1 Tax=Xanthomarina gelatinilytica TaxID=1137281 RepID=UPI003A85E5EF
MNNFKTLMIFAISVSIFAFSCSDDDDPVSPKADYGSFLNNVVLNVVVENYDNLKDASAETLSKCNALTIGDDNALSQAQDAWRAMRVYWENSESTLYGPAGDEGLGVDGNTDSWPIDLSFVNTVLNGTEEITVQFIAQQDANAKGYHALEYLLWGIDGNKTAADLTNREIDYIKATAGYLSNQTADLHNAWSPSGTNFAANLTDADNGIYQSQIAALVQIVDGMSIIADEVGTGKLNDPMYGNNGNYSLEDEESRFSHNSKADFADNIRGIKYVYTGDYLGNSGAGLSELVAQGNATLDAEINAKIDAAISSITNIPGNFTDAIQNNRPAVENAIEKVVDLFNVLDSQLKPYMQNL